MKEKHSALLNLLLTGDLSLSKIAEKLGSDISKTSAYRLVKELVQKQQIELKGAGRNSVYSLSDYGRLFGRFDVESYFENENRKVLNTFNFRIFELLEQNQVFRDEEIRKLYDREREFEVRMKSLPKIARQKEMERLAIDLSWKSSQIEGNTYSLLETEALLKDAREARGKSKTEALMILNHKEALSYILEKPDFFDKLTVSKIEDIHYLLTQNMGVTRNVRSFRVGITGTSYTPLDNSFQISEALEQTCRLINDKKNILEKAFLALVLIAYIQPFEDGNKRTSRIISNAILLANGFCPISFRTVEPIDYRYATLLFYEQNNLSEVKQMFIEQFEFSTSNYF